MALDFLLPSATDITESIYDSSDTAVSDLMATSIVFSKSGDSIAFAMFNDPRLHEISLPISL